MDFYALFKRTTLLYCKIKGHLIQSFVTKLYSFFIKRSWKRLKVFSWNRRKLVVKQTITKVIFQKNFLILTRVTARSKILEGQQHTKVTIGLLEQVGVCPPQLFEKFTYFPDIDAPKMWKNRVNFKVSLWGFLSVLYNIWWWKLPCPIS